MYQITLRFFITILYILSPLYNIVQYCSKNSYWGGGGGGGGGAPGAPHSKSALAALGGEEVLLHQIVPSHEITY